MTRDIYTPAAGESVQIGQQTNSFSISISDELLASLKMSRVRIWWLPYDTLLTFSLSLRTMRLDTSLEGSSHMRTRQFRR
jgi:hypothetical protein